MRVYSKHIEALMYAITEYFLKFCDLIEQNSIAGLFKYHGHIHYTVH